MSKVCTNVSNLKYLPLNSTSSLCFGELSVNINDSDSFIIEGNIKKNTHIVVTSSHSDSILKKNLSNAPTNSNYELTVYDYLSNITNRYLKNREDNSPGNVTNKLSQIKLLSQIVLPKIKQNEELYLVLDSYEVLNEVFLDSSKENIVKKDFSSFCERYSNHNINLFISKNIYDTITKYIDIKSNFRTTICDGCCLSYLVEHLMGKVIYCSDKSYQGHIELSNGIEISSVLIDSKFNDSMIGRSNGILQYNIFNGSSNFKFILILEHSEEISELNFFQGGSIIASSELLQDSDSQITFDYIRSFKDNYDFCNLLKKLEGEEKKRFILENSEKVIKYFIDKMEDNKKYEGDMLELIHLSNIDYLEIIKSLLMNELSNPTHSYSNMKLFGLNFEEPRNYINKHIPLERHVSAAIFDK